VPPVHQVPDLLALNHEQDRLMAESCRRKGVEVLFSGGGGDVLLGSAAPVDPTECRWRPQTFADAFPAEVVYAPRGIEFRSFFADQGIVDAVYCLRRGQGGDVSKRWARKFFRDFLPRELVEFSYCADFWGRDIDGLLESTAEVRRIHGRAWKITRDPYFAEDRLEALLAEDLLRPRKDLYQRIESRISSAVWVCGMDQWLNGEPEIRDRRPMPAEHRENSDHAGGQADEGLVVRKFPPTDLSLQTEHNYR
jgi:hypothetical protein